MNVDYKSWPNGSTIQMFGTSYRIRENHGTNGIVEYLDGTFASSNFYWEYGEDKAEFVSFP